jgi:AcrR family transcriptional regulator
VSEPAAVLAAVRRLYAEDVSSGHVGVVAQMVAGSLNRPDLSEQVLARIEPWVELSADVLRRLSADTPLAALVPVDELAFGLVTYYLGANLLTHLDGGAQTDRLLERIGELLETFSGR